MKNKNQKIDLIQSDQNLPEITFKVIVISILLCLLLAVSNAYLALKIGLLTSASIPAAIISMSILRYFKKSNILENNLIQTAASAGEAVAGGIVYTIPALLIIQFWTSFDYWQNFLITLCGGILGVMFSIPFRRTLVSDPNLPFPEGRAVAEILKASNQQRMGVKDIVYGGIVGAFLELCQTGLKLLADSYEVWFKKSNAIFGFGIGFSPALIGAGYLLSFNLGLCLLFGAVISWLVLIPILSFLSPELTHAIGPAHHIAHQLWDSQIRYVGIGAMLMAGIITLSSFFKPLMAGGRVSLSTLRSLRTRRDFPRTDKDIPLIYVGLVTIFFVGLLYLIYNYLFPLDVFASFHMFSKTLIFGALAYTIIAGFVFCVITAYFSGMVGVTASPGSSVVIASLLIITFILYLILHLSGDATNYQQVQACEGVAIICTAVITGMAAISNDNMQDLKVGYILGATPWKQQLMLLIGVVCASLIISPVMQMLFNAYGIAGVVPRPGMDPNLSLPAPPAAAIAALSKAVFHEQIPWSMLSLGALIVFLLFFVNLRLSRYGKAISLLGVAIGIYLPISSSIPLFLGSFIAWSLRRKKGSHRNVLLSSGLISGAALMDVFLAIPLSLLHRPGALQIAPVYWQPYAVVLSVIAVLLLAYWMHQINNHEVKSTQDSTATHDKIFASNLS